ncbi:MAG: hypothetical protein LBS21_05830, partial [Clostridiales bacterium]|nr:hypothetical protein [Clostridiales bacterium]
MKKITFVCFFVFLILLIASPCAASESGSEPEFTYNQLSANLYCNDYQIDLSRYPLLEICDEITEHDVVYVSAGLHAINEILELYELYRYSDRAFYTRDYLDQSDKWMSRAEFEANLKFHLRENQKTLYYDEGNHEVFYDAGSRASVYIRTLSCGEDYYIDKEWFLKYTNNLEEIMAGVIDKTKITNYNPGYSFVPVIYPNVNEDFFCKEDGKEYDLTRGVN